MAGKEPKIAEQLIEVPERVFTSFLNTLAKEEIDPALVKRLRKTLLVDKTFTDRALKEALFPEVFEL